MSMCSRCQVMLTISLNENKTSLDIFFISGNQATTHCVYIKRLFHYQGRECVEIMDSDGVTPKRIKFKPLRAPNTYIYRVRCTAMPAEEE